jgi:ribonuclease P protein component
MSRSVRPVRRGFDPREGRSREAHLPAQQPPSEQEARVPFTHAHARWSCNRQEPPPSRSVEAVGLTSVPPVAPDRLRSGQEIVAVLRGRRQRAGHLAVLHAHAARPEGGPRVAVVASRRVGNAVSRNRAKRLLREAARRVEWADGTDLVLVARAACASSRLSEVQREVERLAAALGVVADSA